MFQNCRQNRMNLKVKMSATVISDFQVTTITYLGCNQAGLQSSTAGFRLKTCRSGVDRPFGKLNKLSKLWNRIGPLVSNRVIYLSGSNLLSDETLPSESKR
jgi:hypothetical protein